MQDVRCSFLMSSSSGKTRLENDGQAGFGPTVDPGPMCKSEITATRFFLGTGNQSLGGMAWQAGTQAALLADMHRRKRDLSTSTICMEHGERISSTCLRRPIVNASSHAKLPSITRPASSHLLCLLACMQEASRTMESFK